MKELTGEINVIITMNYNIPKQRISDLLCCAFEGGSNYWLRIDKYIYPAGKTKSSYPDNPRYLEVPLGEGGAMIISDSEGGKLYQNKVLNLDSIEKGLKLMAQKFPKAFADFIDENEDGTTGDLFLQLCLFEDEVFS